MMDWARESNRLKTTTAADGSREFVSAEEQQCALCVREFTAYGVSVPISVGTTFFFFRGAGIS